MIRLADGSYEVSSNKSMVRALRHLCTIRCEVAVRYLAMELEPNLSPSVQDLREYRMPGTAVGECHKIYLAKLLPVLKMSHDANENKKKAFDARGACL